MMKDAMAVLFLFPSLWQIHALILLLSVGSSSSEYSPSTTTLTSSRQLWVWANGNDDSAEEQIRQLYNGTWNTLIDGIQAWCGCSFTDHGIELNQTAWNSCMPLVQAAKSTNTKFQLIISGSIPTGSPVEHYITDALALHHHLRSVMDGFSIDDERDCAPRASTLEFVEWVTWQNRFAQGLKPYNLQVTSAVQALFGINSNSNNDPCARHPSDYEFDSQVAETLQRATLQRWLVMDTYYFSTGRFLGALDWYHSYVPRETLGIGLMNRSDVTTSEWTARFYAIDRSGVNWINVFMMPIANELLPFLQRWKTDCADCGKQSMLGCYDLAVSCNQSLPLAAQEF